MLQRFTGINEVLDARFRQGVALARRRQMARVKLTGDTKLHFDSLPPGAQAQAISSSLIAHNIDKLVPVALREDSKRWSQMHLDGRPEQLGSYLALRSDASNSTGGGQSDLDSVFTFGDMMEELTAPIQGPSFIPIRSNYPLGASGVRHRRRGSTGTHLPIAANGGTFGTAAFDIASKTTDLHWYGTESTVYQMEVVDGEFAGYNPQSLIEASTRMVVVQTQENILWNGDTTTALQGILNYDHLAINLGATLDVTGIDAVISTITLKVTDIKRRSSNMMVPNVVVVSDRIFDALARPRAGVAQTGLEALLGALRAIVGADAEVHSAFRLNAAGPAGQDGILYLDNRHGESGLHQIALGPMVIPVSEGIKTTLYYVTKQGGVAQHFEHASTLVWHAITGD